MNNRAKVRRSIRLLVIGTAKVMSYKDLKEAQKKRAKKDTAKAKSKGKRDQKRKSATLKTDAIDLKVKVV